MKKLLWLVLGFSIFTVSFGQESQTATKPDEPALKAYSVEEIREADLATAKEVKSIQALVLDTLYLPQLDSNFTKLKAGIEPRVDKDSIYVDYSEESLWVLKDEGKYWHSYEEEVIKFQSEINERLDELTKELNNLTKLNTRWSLTAKMVDTLSISSGLGDGISENVSLTKKTIDQINSYVDKLIGYSNSVAKELRQVSLVIEQIETLQLEKAGDVLSVDSKSFFTALSEDRIGFGNAFRRAVQSAYEVIVPFAKENRLNLSAHLLLIIILSFVMWNTGKRFRKSTFAEDEAFKTARTILNFPFLSSVALALLLSRFFYSDYPTVFIQILFVIGLLPTIFLLPRILGVRLKYFKFLLILVVILDIFSEMMSADQADQRLLLMITSCLTLFGISYGLWPKGRIRLALNKSGSRLVLFFLFLTGIVLMASIVFNLRGNYQLTVLLTMGVIDSLFVGILAFVAVKVLQSIFQLLIKTGFYGKMTFITKYEKSAEWWSVNLVALYGLLVWGRSVLRSFSLFDAFNNLKNDFLEQSWEFGEVVLSVQNLTDFILILAIFWAISNVLNIVLREVVSTHLDMRKGLPLALAIFSRYVVLFLGFVLAMSAAGISLSKLNLIIGALGVGIGFGLQGIVSNFVSGFVILFERPIHIGDTVTAGLVEGQVTAIGLRSSTIRTWDGAEVIVPNNNLIANEVTNWTYSDKRRRVERIIYVDNGPNPRDVKTVIDNVVRTHEGLLDDPPAQCYFLGNENNALKYRLLMWMDDNILQNPSEVLLNIHDALTTNGYKPFMPVQRIVLSDEHKSANDMNIIGERPKEEDDESDN